jgi:hypothetical protein
MFMVLIIVLIHQLRYNLHRSHSLTTDGYVLLCCANDNKAISLDSTGGSSRITPGHMEVRNDVL